MSVIVKTKANTTDLIELSEVKSRLGISVSTYDTVLGYFIDDVTSAVEQYIAKPLARQQYQENVRGLGRKRLALARFPIDPDTVSITEGGTSLTVSTDYTVEDYDAGVLFRSSGWRDDTDEDVVVTYYAGYLMPGVVTTWAADTAYTAGAWVKPSSPSLSPYLMTCTTAGTSDSTEPTWPSNGSTVTDNTAVWTAHYAWELPSDLKRIAFAAVKHLFETREQMAGLVEQRVEGISERYSEQMGEVLPNWIVSGLNRWRKGLSQ